MKSKWFPLAAGLIAVVVVIVPFQMVNRGDDPDSASAPSVGTSGMSGAGSTAAPLPETSAVDESLSPELKEMAMLEQHLASAPAHAPVLLRLAELARQAGKKEEAVKYLRQAVAAEPANEDARLELGRALFEAGDTTGAIAETRKLVEQNPRNAAALYNLGAIHGNLGNAPEARKFFELAVAADPASESASKSKAALSQLKAIAAPIAPVSTPATSPSARIRTLP